MKKSNQNVGTYSSDNDDSYSTYSEDFDNDSRSSSRNYSKGNRRYNKTRTQEKSDLSEKSFTTTSKYSVSSDNRARKPKKSSGFAKHGWRPSSLHKGSKKAFVVRDSVQARMLSARQHRINTLNNELGEAHIKIDELKKENRLLKTLQHRQDRALRKFEDTENDLPRLISQHSEEQRILKARLRKNQENERVLENKIKDGNEEMLKMASTMKRLKKIVYDKNLGERSELSQQLAIAEDKLYDLERQNKDLEKKLDLTKSSYSRQLNSERSKHKSTKERLEILHEEFLTIQAKLKEKERALDVNNIYALRSKQSPEKSFISNKVAIPSPRRITDKPPIPTNNEFNPSKIQEVNRIGQPPLIPEQQQLALENHPQTPPRSETIPNRQATDVTDFRKMIKSPIVASLADSGREDSPLLDLNGDIKANEIATRLNGLRVQENTPPKEETRKTKPVFLTANFDSPMITPGSTFIADQNERSPITVPTSPPKEKQKEVVKPPDRTKEIEVEQARKKMEESRRKKADLLAKMRNLEEDGSSILPNNNPKDDIKQLLNGTKPNKQVSTSSENLKKSNIPAPNKNNKSKKQNIGKRTEVEIVTVYRIPQLELNQQKSSSLDSPGRSKRQYRFPREVENLHLGIPSTGDLTKEKSDPEISFGGYAPSVAVPPKRKARTTITPKKQTDNESDDEPLFDLDSGKNKKSDLLAQLFGEQAAKPEQNKKEKSFEKNRQPTKMPRAKPVHSGYPWERNVIPASQENGDSKPRTTTNMVVSPVIKSVPSFHDEDIEELAL